jgi:Polyketide cyclase / dehydrase and lipid transport
MLKKILLGSAAASVVLVGLLVIVIAMQPSEFHIERSAKMAAAPGEVFEQVNDFHKWDGWSPWVKLDPNAKNSFEGPAAGEGAIFRWAGNAEVGEGSMTILESRPPEHVRIKLHFVKPFEDTAITEFMLKPAGDETSVTWSMDGKNNFISKAFCLFIMNMDKMIGDKYEEGLASMKKIVEAPEEAKPREESAKPAEETSTKSS